MKDLMGNHVIVGNTTYKNDEKLEVSGSMASLVDNYTGGKTKPSK